MYTDDSVAHTWQSSSHDNSSSFSGQVRFINHDVVHNASVPLPSNAYDAWPSNTSSLSDALPTHAQSFPVHTSCVRYDAVALPGTQAPSVFSSLPLHPGHNPCLADSSLVASSEAVAAAAAATRPCEGIFLCEVAPSMGVVTPCVNSSVPASSEPTVPNVQCALQSCPETDFLSYNHLNGRTAAAAAATSGAVASPPGSYNAQTGLECEEQQEQGTVVSLGYAGQSNAYPSSFHSQDVQQQVQQLGSLEGDLLRHDVAMRVHVVHPMVSERSSTASTLWPFTGMDPATAALLRQQQSTLTSSSMLRLQYALREAAATNRPMNWNYLVRAALAEENSLDASNHTTGSAMDKMVSECRATDSCVVPLALTWHPSPCEERTNDDETRIDDERTAHKRSRVCGSDEAVECGASGYAPYEEGCSELRKRMRHDAHVAGGTWHGGYSPSCENASLTSKNDNITRNEDNTKDNDDGIRYKSASADTTGIRNAAGVGATSSKRTRGEDETLDEELSAMMLPSVRQRRRLRE